MKHSPNFSTRGGIGKVAGNLHLPTPEPLTCGNTGDLVPRLELVDASSITPRRAPWPTFPHCPSCHRRLYSEARRVTPPTDEGRCPHCRSDLQETRA